jgi:hypothetical protein
MTIEVDVLGEMWSTCKQYIASKDRQAAADHVISVIADHDVTEHDLRALAGIDSWLERAVNEYMGDEEFIDDGDEEDENY